MEKNILSVIKNRHSTRFYTSRSVTLSDINEILYAGSLAPSSNNSQPWKFRIINNDTKIQEIAKSLVKSKWVSRCKVLIVIYVLDEASLSCKMKNMMSIGAAIENMLLCATDKNINSCWISEFINEGEKLINSELLYKDYKIVALVALGYENTKFTYKKTERKNLDKLLIR